MFVACNFKIEYIYFVTNGQCDIDARFVISELISTRLDLIFIFLT